MQQLFRKNDRQTGEVFEELLVQHLDHLYAFAVRLTRNRHSAEDLVQEAVLRAFQAFENLRDKSRFKNWMFRILRNIFLNKKKKQKPGPLAEIEEPLSKEGEDLVLGYVLSGEIREALDCLSLEYRLTLWLSDVEGCTQKEIAEILDCSIGTVGSRLHRARSALRGLVKNRGKKSSEVSS